MRIKRIAHQFDSDLHSRKSLLNLSSPLIYFLRIKLRQKYRQSIYTQSIVLVIVFASTSSNIEATFLWFNEGLHPVSFFSFNDLYFTYFTIIFSVSPRFMFSLGTLSILSVISKFITSSCFLFIYVFLVFT